MVVLLNKVMKEVKQVTKIIVFQVLVVVQVQVELVIKQQDKLEFMPI